MLFVWPNGRWIIGIFPEIDAITSGIEFLFFFRGRFLKIVNGWWKFQEESRVKGFFLSVS